MITRTAKIRAMSIIETSTKRTPGKLLGGCLLPVALLLDNGYVLRTKRSTLDAWGDAMQLGATIAYDVDEQGALSNPRPAPHAIVQGTTACPCGDEPASCQKANCLLDAP